jgi:hypothetical protein
LALEVKGTLEELRELFLQGVVSEAQTTAKRAGKKLVKKVVKKTLTTWQRFLRDFKFRKQKRNEKSSTYFGLRTKAASRAYRRTMKQRRK